MILKIFSTRLQSEIYKDSLRVFVQTQEIAVHAGHPKSNHSCCCTVCGFFDLHANAPPGPSSPAVGSRINTHPRSNRKTKTRGEY